MPDNIPMMLAIHMVAACVAFFCLGQHLYGKATSYSWVWIAGMIVSLIVSGIAGTICYQYFNNIVSVAP